MTPAIVSTPTAAAAQNQAQNQAQKQISRRTWSIARLLVWTVVIYTVLRVYTTVVLSWIASTQQDPSVYSGEYADYFEFAVLWDGDWYREIATEGYPAQLPRNDQGEVRQNAWAFYPLFPMMVRAVMTVTGLGFPVAAVAVATALGYAAAMAMAILLVDRVGPKVALGAVALFAAFPASPTMQVAYTESLAMLLLCIVLYFLGKERWLLAALVALLTGIARPIAIPLGVVALVMVVLRWRRRHSAPIGRGEWARMLTALAACGASGLIWPALVWRGTGEADGYALTMSAWRSGDDIVPFQPAFWVSRFLFDDWGPVLLIGLIVLLVVAVLGPWARALGPDLRAWTLAYPMYLVAMTFPWTSTYRYLLPMIGIYVLLIGGGWRPGEHRRGEQPTWVMWTRVGAFVLLFLGWQLWWSWELFQFVPPSDFPP